MKTQTLVSIGFRTVALAATLAAWPAHAEPDRYAGPNFALVDAKKTLAAAAEITLEKYPDCDDATVEQRLVEVYRADGTAEAQDEEYVKVLTEKGKRSRRTLRLDFMLPYSTVEVAKIEIIKPTGEVSTVDIAANSKETIDNGQMAMNIYDPNSKVLEVNIPTLEVGDVLHTVTHNTTLRSVIAGEFADENVFEGAGFIRHVDYEVHAPLDKPLQRIAVRDEVPGSIKYTTHPGDDHTLVHHWEVTNVPRMFPEPVMPSGETVLQRVLVSTTPDWRNVSKWYWELSRPHLEATDTDLRNKVESLTAGAKTDEEKIDALFHYVSPTIRYMGLTPEKDRPGFEPHDVNITFDKSYGVCRDKAALLVSMLRTAGLPAYPVLINVGSKKDKEVPDAGFNHAIVGVQLIKGGYLLMDPTDEHARELLPVHDTDQSYLVCRPEGEDIRVSAVKPAEENMMLIKTTGSLTAAGELKAKSELSFGGANDDRYRGGFAHMKPDDRQRFFESCLKQNMPGARLTSLKITPEDMMDISKELKAEVEYSVDGMTATGNGKSVVSLPWIGNSLGAATMILEETGLDKRKYPMQTRLACGLREEVAMKLGEGFAGPESAPTYTPVDDDCLRYRQSFEAKNGELKCSRELDLKVDEFSPAQYAELKHTLKELEYDTRKTPVLAMASGVTPAPSEKAQSPAAAAIDSNALILNSAKELVVTDPHTAVLKVRYAKQILTYAGKIREAEVKIDYNPACEEARFIRGVVTSKTGERKEISKGEMNVMDAGWNARAKRYTGGKILVANLPGVDIGSTIEVEYEIAMKGKPYLGGFESFQFRDEEQRKSFTLSAPANLKIEKLATHGGPEEMAFPAGTISNQLYLWNSEHVKALPSEPFVPPSWVWNSGVLYFVGDFNAYLAEVKAALLNRSQSRAKVEEQVRQLTGKSKTEKIAAIRDFVAKSIREAGPFFGALPLSELSAADLTLTDGYGNDADRAILLHAMLTAAGFQPDFVLASSLAPVEGVKSLATTFPLPYDFSKLLVKVSVDGQAYYLNDTDQYARLGATGNDNHLGIALSNGGYEVIQAAPDCRDKTETVYTLSIAENGKLQMGVTERYFGAEYNSRNRYFSELRPEERKRYFQELISGVGQGARPVGELTDQFDTYPGSEHYAVELDNYAVVDGKYLYFDLPFTPWLFYKSIIGGDQRTLPLLVPMDEKRTVRTEIELPRGFGVVVAPASQSLDAPGGRGKVRVNSSISGGKFVMTDEFETSPGIVEPKDYPAMLEVEAALEKKSGKVFLLQKE